MIPSLAINEHWQTRLCFLTGSRIWVCTHPLDSHTAAVAIISRNQPCSHLDRPLHSRESEKTSPHPSRPQIVSVSGVPKSP
jgi:hypothetical protein